MDELIRPKIIFFINQRSTSLKLKRGSGEGLRLSLYRKEKRPKLQVKVSKEIHEKVKMGFSPTSNTVQRNSKQKLNPHKGLQRAFDSFLSDGPH